MTAPALEVQHLNRNFGALQVARDIDLTPGAWRPAGADRAERRRQDHSRQSDQRRARSLFRPDAALRRGHHEALPGRAGAAGHRADFPDQSAVPPASVLENICLAIGERSGVVQQSVAVGRFQRATWSRKRATFSVSCGSSRMR